MMIKSFSRRIFFWTLAMMTGMALGIIGGVFYGGRWLARVMPLSVLQEAALHSETLKTGLDRLMPVMDLLNAVFIPSVLFLFFLTALIFWLILRGSVVRAYRKFGIPQTGAEARASKKQPAEKSLKDRPLPDAVPEPVITKKDLAESNRRFYLHLLSLLQREGRLMDFFDEDLSLYDDAQIGAAVRGIQDGCKNCLKKHIQPKPVMDQSEGETITVPADFDPNAIKLTGNVTGEPPFKGTLRHRGWRAGRLELPTLTPVRDAGIISPAEVEIQ